ncbi:MAG: hypothetical protein WD075_03215 [Rhodospirillales bacterium]
MIDKIGCLLSRNRWRATLSLAAVFLIVTISAFVASKKDDPDELKMPANVHYAFNYYPKYNYADCIFRVSIKEKHGIGNDSTSRIKNLFGYYVFANEPETGAFGFSSEAHSGEYIAEFEFMDKCEEAPHIIDSGLKAAQHEVDFEYTFISKSKSISNASAKNSTFWLDSPNYDPDYWGLRKSVSGSCDPADWLRLARLEAAKNNTEHINLGYIHASYARELSASNTEVRDFINQLSDRISESNKVLARKIVTRAYETSTCDK